MPEIDVSWNFLVSEHRFSDLATKTTEESVEKSILTLKFHGTYFSDNWIQTTFQCCSRSRLSSSPKVRPTLQGFLACHSRISSSMGKLDFMRTMSERPPTF